MDNLFLERHWTLKQAKLKKKAEITKDENRNTVCVMLTGNDHKHILLTLPSTMYEFWVI